MQKLIGSEDIIYQNGNHRQWKELDGHSFDSDVNRYQEIRKLTTRQVEDYTTGCLLDYDCS